MLIVLNLVEVRKHLICGGGDWQYWVTHTLQRLCYIYTTDHVLYRNPPRVTNPIAESMLYSQVIPWVGEFHVCKLRITERDAWVFYE